MAKYSKRADGRYSIAITVTLDGEKKKKPSTERRSERLTIKLPSYELRPIRAWS